MSDDEEAEALVRSLTAGGYVVGAAVEQEALADVMLPVARLGHLVALNLLARDDRHRPVRPLSSQRSR